MTAVQWAFLIGAGWTLLAIGLGILIGRVIRQRDRQVPRDDEDES